MHTDPLPLRIRNQGTICATKTAVLVYHSVPRQVYVTTVLGEELSEVGNAAFTRMRGGRADRALAEYLPTVQVEGH